MRDDKSKNVHDNPEKSAMKNFSARQTRPTTTTAGRLGEKAAAEFLEKKGFRILHMNYRVSHLEIDIIAEDDEHLIFVEVKSRTENERNTARFGRPAAAVTKEKRQNLLSAANSYLRTNKTQKRPRLDVIEVYFTEQKLKKPQISRIHHIENAFGAR